MKNQHPGPYIKSKIIPDDVTVKEASEQLGFSRPSLTNVLNGRAPLTPKLAEKIEHVFGGSAADLLKMQVDFDQASTHGQSDTNELAPYVPPHMEVRAREITAWANRVDSRAHLAALLRRLIHSTTMGVIKCDFPAYDQSQTHGWDGQVETTKASPWVPDGFSGWEFGTNQDPKGKADSDYKAREKAMSDKEKSETTFVFVTPRNWPGKDKWVKDKLQNSKWANIRAYDASDLEQWIEQSLPAQAWFAYENGRDPEGAMSLEQCHVAWLADTEPQLNEELFREPIEYYARELKQWATESTGELVIVADSLDEGLAFIHAANLILGDTSWSDRHERLLVFSDGKTLKKLAGETSQFVPILVNNDAQKSFAPFSKSHPHIVIQTRGQVTNETSLIIEPLSSRGFRSALESLGHEHDEIDRLERESGRSPTILRRRLSKLPGVRMPTWSGDEQSSALIAISLAGVWHSQNDNDKSLLSLLSELDYADVERELTNLVTMEDSPVWSLGRYRGIKSQIDVLFALSSSITETDIRRFFEVAEMVLGEDDPALDLPEKDRYMAAIRGKTRDFSPVLRKSIGQMAMLLAVYGDDLFEQRLGFRVSAQAQNLVQNILSPLSVRGLEAAGRDITVLAEMSPKPFLDIIEADLVDESKSVCLELMRPVSQQFFGARCDRTGLLWALEMLAWNEAYLERVVIILAKLSSRKIDDNWVNKPINSLASVFRSWLPQTSANLEQRTVIFDRLWKSHPSIAWKIATGQLDTRFGTAFPNHKPDWRDDARKTVSVSNQERHDFVVHCLELCLSKDAYTPDELCDLIHLANQWYPAAQSRLWNSVTSWASTASDQEIAKVRETVRLVAYSRRAIRRAKRNDKDEFDPVEVANTYDALQPTDITEKHGWLFKDFWIQGGFQDDLDHDQEQKLIREAREKAISEVYETGGLSALLELARKSNNPSIVGEALRVYFGKTTKINNFISELFALDSALIREIDGIVTGCLYGHTEDELKSILEDVAEPLNQSLRLRLLLSSPFCPIAWDCANVMLENESEYWAKANARFVDDDEDQLRAATSLLSNNRPVSALNLFLRNFSGVPTPLLCDVLEAIAKQTTPEREIRSMDSHQITEAFKHLNEIRDVDRNRLFQLEIMFMRLLVDSDYGLPNLEKEIEKNPIHLIDALVYMYKRDDGGDDPARYQNLAGDSGKRAESMFHLLRGLKRIPGCDEKDAELANKILADWIKQVQDSSNVLARREVADAAIGELLARAPVGNDNVWPSENIRDAMEETLTESMASGFRIGKYNSRGVVMRGEGGDQERALESEYREHSKKLKLTHPSLSRAIAQLADTYKNEAQSHDLEAQINRRGPMI